MDFIVSRPGSLGCCRIWVIVDRFTTMAHFFPLKTQLSIQDLARTVLRQKWCLHGLREEII